ncbi:MFS transporter [Gordonia sp. DT30]|uniref:MFS transporter n=1 Tax=unclassified Gordonia (in: high G+C Gram-positive bacteria) TaxID=2657482 RepID=UPI003CF75500
MQRSRAFLVAGCFFMEMLDTTVVTTAAPLIGHSLNQPPTAISVVITAYLLALAVFIPVGGWLITRWTARTVFTTAIVVFTVASLACGFAPSLGWLVLARVVQGVGGALMVPVGRQVVLRSAAKTDVLRLMSYIVWPGLLAPVVAPLIGAVIAEQLSWEWIFWVNVPLGVVAAVVAWRIMPDDVEGPPRRLDWVGVAVVGGGLGTALWAAHLIADTGAGAGIIAAWIAAPVILCALACRHLLSTPTPVVDLRLLGNRVFGLSQAGMAGFFMVVMAIPFLMPLMMQTAFGWSPVRSGVLVMFVFIGNVGIKPATTPLLNAFGFRTVLGVSTLGLAATAVALGCATASTPAWLIAVVALVSGVFRSTALTAYSTIGFATIDVADRRTANTVAATVQQVASGLGVAVAAVGVRLGAAITGDTTASGTYFWAFLVAGAVALASLIAVARLPRQAGAELRTR